MSSQIKLLSRFMLFFKRSVDRIFHRWGQSRAFIEQWSSFKFKRCQHGKLFERRPIEFQ